MSRCPNCGAPVSDGGVYCPQCGQRQRREPAPAEGCRNCGAGLLEDANFCQYCGADQSADEDAGTVACWHCEASLVRQAVECHSCGEPQASYDRWRGPDQWFCHVCGTVVRSGANYCRLCGESQE